jgi:PAS domain S-box-containing protein
MSWQAMVSLSRLFRGMSALPEITPAVLEQVVGLIGGEAAAVALRDPDSDKLTLQLTSGAWSAWTGQLLPNTKWLERVIAEGRPCVEECTSLGNLPLGNCKTLWCTPLIAGQECYGVLFANTSHPTRNDAFDVLALVGDWVASRLRSQTLDERLRQLYEQLEGRERLINRILEGIPLSLVVIDPALRVVSANRNFLEKSRRGMQNTLGHLLSEVFPKVLLDYMQLDRTVPEVFRTGQAMEGGKVAYRSPGLPTRIYYYRLLPIKTDKAIENVMLFMDDITEREQLGQDVRKAERHLASIVECANDIVASLDTQGRILTWNRAAVRLSGLSEQQAVGCFLSDLCAAEQRSGMDAMLQSLTNKTRVGSIEANLLTVQGKPIFIAWSFSAMRDDAQKVVGIVAVGHDLTEQRQLQAQLIHSAKMASLGVMAGGIAHELRNPLGVISAAVQLMQEHIDDKQMLIECSQRSYAATRRASSSIESLLRFARPQSEQGMHEINIHILLEEALALLENQMTLNKVKLYRSFASNLPVIEGNFSLLQQVFTNMIQNACNAMLQGGTLTISTGSDQPGWVQIRFVDTGCGISEENLMRIFDPFFTTMPVGRGTGLGLSISYNIIQQHQGTIEVQSQVGRGTEFVLRLPTHLVELSKLGSEADGLA